MRPTAALALWAAWGLRGKGDWAMKMLQMTDITKAFSGVTVLNRVNFDVEPG